MTEFIFTIDYEIYGNGEGSLKELVYEPAERLMEIFQKYDAHFVLFVEVAELEIIETKGTDSAIDLVRRQIRRFYNDGFEIALHLHPQWYNADYENGRWLLDYSEYNLCTLPRERISQIVDRSISYLRQVLGASDYTPVSFRAGNWLFQPTRSAAAALAERGIKVDSSVFKGGLQHQHKLDYRRALQNGYYWRFTDHVNIAHPEGALVELPIYTRMVPFWKMLTTKRLRLQRQGVSVARTGKQKLNRLLDFSRFRHPLKFDFCRMTAKELIQMTDIVIQEDQGSPAAFKPIVAIGHTKDLVDLETIDTILAYLREKQITVSTFKSVYPRCT